MTRTVNPPSLRYRFLQSFLLTPALGWLGGLGMYGNGVALAQVTSALSPEPVLPVELPPPAQVDPEVAVPEPSSRNRIATPEPVLETPAVVLSSPKPVVESDRYEQPSQIVLSERSTGCQATVQYGQGITSGPCGVVKSAAAISTMPAVQQLAHGVAAVQVAALGSASLTVRPSTTPLVRDYYNRTVRPPGRLGNGNIRLIFPLSIPAAISSAFGWRVHPITGSQRLHTGTDLAAPLGTPVLAAYAGQVAISDFLGGYGLTVTLAHNKGTQETLYAHLSEIFVKPGEWVEQGKVIGRVGSTGLSTGPHLHFEFRQLTPDGWVALDAGTQLEYALAQLMKVMQTAQTPKLVNPSRRV